MDEHPPPHEPWMRRLQASHPYILVFGVFAPALALIGVASLFVLGEPTIAQSVVAGACWLLGVACLFVVARASHHVRRSTDPDSRQPQP